MANPIFTPAFNNLRDIFKLASMSPAWKEILDLQTKQDPREAEKKIAQKIKQISQSLEADPKPEAIDKLVQFLQKMIRANVITQQILDAALGERDKTTALLQLFQDQSITDYLTEQLTKFTNLSREQQKRVIARSYGEGISKRNDQVASQAVYDEFSRPFIEIFEAFFTLYELALVHLGFELHYYNSKSSAGSNKEFVPMPGAAVAPPAAPPRR